MAELDRVLCAFSPGGESFALATPDGRIKVFDAGSGRMLARLSDPAPSTSDGGSNGHLADVLTCICWVVPKEKKKQAVNLTGLAVGTAAGDVKLYDVKLGELRWRAVNCIEGGVKSLAFCASSGSLLTTGKNCSIASLELLKGKVQDKFEASKYPLTCIGLTPDAKHVFGGGSSMQLWELSSQERVAKYTGHMTEVRALAMAPGTSYAASAASGERQVSMWEVPPAKKSKKQHPSVASLVLDEPAVQLDAASISGHEEEFHVAAVSEAGEAYVWRCQGSADGSLSSDLVLRVRVGSGTVKGAAAGKDECIMAAKLQTSTSGRSLLIARGSTAKPSFETLPVPSSSSSDPLVALPAVGGVLLGNGVASTSGQQAGDKSAKKAVRGAADVAVLGPENLGQAVMVRSADAAAAAGGSSKKRAAQGGDDDDAETLLGGGRGGAESEEEVPDLPEGEVPLGERVAALEARSGHHAAHHAPEEAGTSGAGDTAQPAGSSKADSLSVLLTQAIRSNDRALLERVLANTNPAIVNNTIARIVPTDAAAFLKASVDRLLSKPNRAVQLVPWIKSVLHHHTGYLMTAPGVQPTLTALFQAIDVRVKLHEPLLKVHGRLGLVLHHTRPDASSGAEPGRPGPETVFEDDLDDDDEPAAEDAFAPNLDDGDDDDDESDDDDDDGFGDDDEDDSEENEFDRMLADGAGSDDDDDLMDL